MRYDTVLLKNRKCRTGIGNVHPPHVRVSGSCPTRSEGFRNSRIWKIAIFVHRHRHKWYVEEVPLPPLRQIAPETEVGIADTRLQILMLATKFVPQTPLPSCHSSSFVNNATRVTCFQFRIQNFGGRNGTEVMSFRVFKAAQPWH